MYVTIFCRLVIGAFVCFMHPLYAQAEKNKVDMPADSELDEEVKGVLKRVERPAGIQSEVWDDIVRRYKLQVSRNVDIHFYGQVIDQDGLPLEGVKVVGFVRAFDVGYLGNLPAARTDQKDNEWVAISGKDGRFVVRGFRGLSLHLKSFEKDGYVAPSCDDYYGYSEKHFHGKVHKPQERSPVIFKMWLKKESGARTGSMKKESGVSAGLIKKEIKISGDSNGVDYRIDLVKGERVQSETVPCDIIIKIVSTPPPKDVKAKYDWCLSLSAPIGGIIATEEAYPYKAPQSGYVSTVKVDSLAADKSWSRRIEKKYYIQSRDSSFHAAIAVKAYAFRDGKVIVEINSVGNSGGSLDLMPLH